MGLKYECIEDKILIRPIKEDGLKKTEGGIIDPNIKAKPVTKGEIVAAGPGIIARETGVPILTILRAGDIVLYPTDAGMEIDIEKDDGGMETVRVMREGDILLAISKK